MKIFTVLLLGTVIALPLKSQDAFLEDFRDKWVNASAYTLEFAEVMPASMYDYKPTEDQMTFSRQLVHLAGNMLWLCHAYLGGEEIDIDIDHPPSDKKALIALLRKTFDYAENTICGFDPEDLDDIVDFPAKPLTKRQVFFLLTDHLTHHRGQLVVYLRLNDITPPKYRGW